MLRRRDSGRGAIDFVDIAAPDYDPAVHGGISFERAMERIHAVLRDGTVVTGERWLGWAGGAGALHCAALHGGAAGRAGRVCGVVGGPWGDGPLIEVPPPPLLVLPPSHRWSCLPLTLLLPSLCPPPHPSLCPAPQTLKCSAGCTTPWGWAGSTRPRATPPWSAPSTRCTACGPSTDCPSQGARTSRWCCSRRRRHAAPPRRSSCSSSSSRWRSGSSRHPDPMPVHRVKEAQLRLTAERIASRLHR